MLPVNNNATDIDGGYYVLGNIVMVSVFFKTANTATNDCLSMLRGFPLPNGIRASLSVYASNKSDPHAQASIENTGYLRLSGTYSAGENIAVSGLYLKK